MDNFMGGLEKFGLGGVELTNLFNDEEQQKEKKVEEIKPESTEEVINEEDFLFDKNVECVVCGKKFLNRSVRASKIRRIGADDDLRPRYKGCDVLKYDVCSCPYCGYTAMNRYFEGITTGQARLVRETVSSKFQPTTLRITGAISYDMAIDRYKLALYNSMVKKAKVSERAYTCLKIAWLCRGKAEELVMEMGRDPKSQGVLICKKEERSFYEQAYEGLLKAVSSESFPMCGMDNNTMDYLLAQMSFSLGKYEMTSRLLARLLGSNASSHVKDKALDLKQELIAKLKQQM